MRVSCLPIEVAATHFNTHTNYVVPGWIDSNTASQAALHYAGYSVKNQYGLRIITLNSDFWYKSNFLNFINTTDPDVSGSLKFLIQELQAAEDAGERVWILFHVLTGWGTFNFEFLISKAIDG